MNGLAVMQWISVVAVCAVVGAIVGGLIGTGIAEIVARRAARSAPAAQSAPSGPAVPDVAGAVLVGVDTERMAPCCQAAARAMVEQSGQQIARLMLAGDTDAAARIVTDHFARAHDFGPESPQYADFLADQQRSMAAQRAVIEAERIVRGGDSR